MKETVTTYEPDNSLRNGYLSMFSEIFTEFKQNWWLTYQFFRRDFLSAYKQSFVGISWAFIAPLLSIGLFILLNDAGIFVVGDINVPYAIYALNGLIIWQLFSTGLDSSSNSLIRAGDMITKINFSKKSLVVASIGQSLVSFLIQFVLLVLLFVFYGIVPSPSILLIPVLIIPIILLTLGLGFILSILNGVVRDVGNLISLSIAFLMLMTPIFYTKPKMGILGILTPYNPLYYLVAVPRDLILVGTTSEWTGFMISTILAVMIFTICLFAFHLTETRVAERI